MLCAKRGRSSTGHRGRSDLATGHAAKRESVPSNALGHRYLAFTPPQVSERVGTGTLVMKYTVPWMVET